MARIAPARVARWSARFTVTRCYRETRRLATGATFGKFAGSLRATAHPHCGASGAHLAPLVGAERALRFNSIAMLPFSLAHCRLCALFRRSPRQSSILVSSFCDHLAPAGAARPGDGGGEADRRRARGHMGGTLRALGRSAAQSHGRSLRELRLQRRGPARPALRAARLAAETRVEGFGIAPRELPQPPRATAAGACIALSTRSGRARCARRERHIAPA